MGCSQSYIEPQITTSVDKQPQPFTISRHPLFNQKSNRIMENCIVVWLVQDSSIDIKKEQTKLSQMVSWMKTFTDPNECITYITSILVEKVFLIAPTMDLLLHQIQSLPQVEKIYILNSSFHEDERQTEHPLSLNSFDDFESLCKQLQTDIELCELDLLDITASAAPTQGYTPSIEFKKHEALFLHAQLQREVFFRLKFEKNAKDEFIHFFRIHYSDNDEQLRIIDDFEANYRPQKALWWLARRCFIRRVIQRIQRTPEIDIRYKMSFLLKDIYTQLSIFQENKSSITENRWIVYRGKTMSNDQFDILMRNNPGGFLSLSGFFAANTDKEVGVDFVCRRLSASSHMIGILFEIHVNSSIRSLRSPFASLDEVSSDETNEKNGIFFSMYTVFRIESVEQITEKSINMWSVKLTSISDDNPQLLRIVSPLRSSEVYADPLAYMGKLFKDNGNYEQVEHFFLGMLQDTYVLSQPRRLARVQKGLGSIYQNMGDYAKALVHYQQALEASLSYLSSDHMDLVPLYHGIGDSYYKQGDYFNALQNYEKEANLLKNRKQPMNDQFINDLHSRIATATKLLNNKQ